MWGFIRAGLVACGLLAAASAHAAGQDFTIPVDLDSNPVTGCVYTHPAATGGVIPGAELRIHWSAPREGDETTIAASGYERCIDGQWQPATGTPSITPELQDGIAAFGLSLPRTVLGDTDAVTLALAASDGEEGGDALDRIGANPIVWVLEAPVVAIPVLSAWLIAVLMVALAAVALWRGRLGRGGLAGWTSVGLLIVVGAHLGAVQARETPTLAQLWAGIAPLASDPEGDAIDPGPDLLSLSAQIKDGDVHLLVRIKPVNHAPAFTSTPPTEGTAGAPLAYLAVAQDPDGDDIEYALLSGPAGASLDAASGELTWTPAEDGDYAFTLAATDPIGASDTQTFTVTVGESTGGTNRPPAFTSVPPTTVTVGEAYTYAPTASDPDSDPVTLALDDGPTGMVLDGGVLAWTPQSEGTADVRLSASDGQGGVAYQDFTITVSEDGDTTGNRAPTFTSTPEMFAQIGQAYRYAPQVSDPDGDAVTVHLIHGPSGLDLDSDSALGGTLGTEGQFLIILEARDARGAATQQRYLLAALDDQTLPPDPKDTATDLGTTDFTPFEEGIRFLYTGANPVQTGVAPGTIDEVFAAVINGQVKNRAGEPIPGVQLTLLNHPEYGATRTRADGEFDLVVNGGDTFVVNYTKPGYLPVQRKVPTQWQSHARAPDVVMIPLSEHAAVLDTSGAATDTQVYRGPLESDESGSRRATVLLPAGTRAELEQPDGSRAPLTTMTLRATEYTVGDTGPSAMPGPLPYNVGYTYAVELSADEAIATGAAHVRFDRPVAVYVDNFLDFPVGEPVPVGWYDYATAAWQGDRNGLIIRVLAIDDGQAVLELDEGAGPASAQDLAELGITEDELKTLAELHQAGDTLWRVRTEHFTPGDFNWPWAPPLDSPPPTEPPTTEPPPDVPPEEPPEVPPTEPPKEPPTCADCDCVGGCEIDPARRTLGETIAINGTPLSLNYHSQLASHLSTPVPPGQDPDPDQTHGLGKILITVTKEDVPEHLLHAEVSIKFEGAGVSKFRRFSTAASQHWDFQWDGRDRYGRLWSGSDEVAVTVTYVYPLVYYSSEAEWERAWGQYAVGGGSGGGGGGGGGGSGVSEPPIHLMARLYPPELVRVSRTWHLTVASPIQPTSAADSVPIGAPLVSMAAAGGWSLNLVDSFDPRMGRLYLGRGGVVDGHSLPLSLSSIGASVPSSTLSLYFGPDNGFYFTVKDEGYGNRILRRLANGNTVLIAGGIYGSGGDGGAAVDALLDTPDLVRRSDSGELWFSDQKGAVLRHIDAQGIIHSRAGGGTQPLSQMGGPALDFVLDISGLLPHPDGSVWMTVEHDLRHRLVRFEQTGHLGVLSAADGSECLTEQEITTPVPMAAVCFAEPPVEMMTKRDGRIVLAFLNGLFELGPDGMFGRLAGNPAANNVVDDLRPAQSVRLLLESAWIDSRDRIFFLTMQDGGRAIGLLDTYGQVRPLSAIADGEEPRPGLHLNAVQPREGSLLFGSGDDRLVIVTPGWMSLKVSTPYPGYDGSSLLVPSRNGQEILEFSPRGRHLRTLDALTGATRWRFAYDAAGRVMTVEDIDGDTTRIERDGLGRIGQIIGPDGHSTHLEYSADGKLAGVSDAAGGTHRMTYTAGGLMTSIQYPNGRGNRFTFDSFGRLVSDVDDAGGGWTINGKTIYWQDRRLSANTFVSGEGRRTTYMRNNPYGGPGTVIYTESPDGLITESVEKWNGWVERRYPDGSRTLVKREADSLVGAGARQLKEMSAWLGSRRVRVQSTSEVEQDEPGNPLSLNTRTWRQVVNDRSFETRYTRTTGVIETTSAQGRTATLHVDPARRPLSIAVPDLATTVFDYDTRGRLIRAQSADGSLRREVNVTYHEDGPGRGLPATVTDPLGRQMHYDYDAVGRLVTQILTDGRTIAYTYDPSGNLTSLTPPGRSAHRFEYESRDELAAYDPPSLAGVPEPATRYHYNLDKQLTVVTRPDGQQVSVDYHATNGRLLGYSADDGAGVSVEYNAFGHVSAQVTQDGNRLDYTLDGPLLTGWQWTGAVAGRVDQTLDRNLWRTALSINGQEGVFFNYDSDGLLVQAGAMSLSRRANDGRLSATSLDLVHTLQGYNAFGEMVDYSVTVPAPLSELAMGVIERLNQLDQVLRQRLDPTGTEYIALTRYDMPEALRLAHQLPSSRTTLQNHLFFTFVGDGYWGPRITLVTTEEWALYDGIADLLGQIEPQPVNPEETAYWSHLQYDALGRIIAQSGEIDGDTQPAREYRYDLAGRLVEVRRGGWVAEAYNYDVNGNRIEATVDGNTVTADYDAQDRLLRYGNTVYTYTANGELLTRTDAGGTTTYTYDAFGNLRRVQQPDGTLIEYIIDARHRRIGKRIDGQLQHGWLYQDQLNPVAELDGQGNIVAQFVYGDRGNVPSYVLKDGKSYRIIADHLGSPRLIIDSDTGAIVQRMDYDTWGNVTQDTNPGFQPFGFAGGLYDRDTGLVRFGARDYDPGTGRWTAKDPILFAGGDTNLYGYVLNDPVNWFDPNGLDGEKPNAVSVAEVVASAASSSAGAASAIAGLASEGPNFHLGILARDYNEYTMVGTHSHPDYSLIPGGDVTLGEVDWPDKGVGNVEESMVCWLCDHLKDKRDGKAEEARKILDCP